jgi:hypothetical protein
MDTKSVKITRPSDPKGTKTERPPVQAFDPHFPARNPERRPAEARVHSPFRVYETSRGGY